VTVAIWVGYDNAEGKRRTLGSGQTGAKVAVPIFEPIIQAVWANHSSMAALNGPSPEALIQLVAVRADPGRDKRSGRGTAVEYLRRDQNGQAKDGAYELISRGRADRASASARAERLRWREQDYNRDAPTDWDARPQWRGDRGRWWPVRNFWDFRSRD
jgi:membrane carboxypeptidase/penicillin-binding protein